MPGMGELGGCGGAGGGRSPSSLQCELLVGVTLGPHSSYQVSGSQVRCVRLAALAPITWTSHIMWLLECEQQNLGVQSGSTLPDHSPIMSLL